MNCLVQLCISMMLIVSIEYTFLFTIYFLVIRVCPLGYHLVFLVVFIKRLAKYITIQNDICCPTQNRSWFVHRCCATKQSDECTYLVNIIQYQIDQYKGKENSILVILCSMSRKKPTIYIYCMMVREIHVWRLIPSRRIIFPEGFAREKFVFSGE